MKKLLALVSSAMCLFAASAAHANQYAQPCPHYAQPRPCPNMSYVPAEPCVGQCAQPCKQGNFYMGAFGGANWLNVNRIDGVKPSMKLGYAGALSAGYKFTNGIRLEAEVAYRRNQFNGKDWLKEKYEDAELTGFTSSWAYMGNFLYDFDCVSRYLPKVVPYVGFGVGYTRLHANGHAKTQNEEVRIKADSHGVAGQAIAGIGYRLTDSTTIGAEYRYFVGREHARDHSVGLSLRQSF